MRAVRARVAIRAVVQTLWLKFCCRASPQSSVSQPGSHHSVQSEVQETLARDRLTTSARTTKGRRTRPQKHRDV